MLLVHLMGICQPEQLWPEGCIDTGPVPSLPTFGYRAQERFRKKVAGPGGPEIEDKGTAQAKAVGASAAKHLGLVLGGAALGMVASRRGWFGRPWSSL